MVRNGFVAKLHAGFIYFHKFSMDFLEIVIFRSAIKPRCAYFSGVKRFSKNRPKVHEMAHLEATVASGVKNWYINFVSNCYEVVGNANWCQNSESFREIGLFRLQVVFVLLRPLKTGLKKLGPGPWAQGTGIR